MSSDGIGGWKRKSLVIEDTTLDSRESSSGKGKKLKVNQGWQIRSVVSKVGSFPKQTNGKESGKIKKIKGKQEKN